MTTQQHGILIGVVLSLATAAAADEKLYSITLAKALPGDKDVSLVCRVGGTGVAFGLNGTGHDVDATSLTIKEGHVGGAITVKFRFDGYLPADGRACTIKYELTGKIEGDKLAGAFTSEKAKREWQGAAAAAPDYAGYQMMQLNLENAAGNEALGPKSWGHRGLIRILWKDGQPVQALMYGHGGRPALRPQQRRVDLPGSQVIDVRRK